MSSNRRPEFDVLRALAIGLILLGHVPGYFSGSAFANTISAIDRYFPFAFFGLVLFFFISGFLIEQHNVINRRQDLANFLSKRVFRIYPLYWIALTLFFIGFEIRGVQNLSLAGVVINYAGAQGLLAPRFVAPIETLWFVGVILLFYLLYPLIAYLSSNSRNMWFAVVAIFAFFVVLRVAFDIVDFRFFLYYGIFVAGIVASKYDLFHIHKIGHSSVFYITVLCLTVVIRAAIMANTVAGDPQLGAYDASLFSITNTLVTIFLNAVGLLVVYSTYNIVRLHIPSMNATSLKVAFVMAFSSYCVYLFHRPFLSVFTISLTALHFAIPVGIVTTILIGLPLLFVLSYVIQSRENRLIDRLKAARKNKT
jgi:peptidoglycan/LPS O-acetylase OafA/YrhL